MDKPSWGMQFLLWPEEKSKPVIQRRYLLQIRKCDPEMSISIRVRIADSGGSNIHIPGNLYSHRRNVYSHPRNQYSHPAGIFDSHHSGNLDSHRSEYAIKQIGRLI
jgi:hypothetical protein